MYDFLHLSSHPTFLLYIALIVYKLFHLLIITKWHKKEFITHKRFHPSTRKYSILKRNKIIAFSTTSREKSMFISTWMRGFSKNETLSKSSMIQTWGTSSSKYHKKDFLNWWECYMQNFLTPMVSTTPKLKSTPSN